MTSPESISHVRRDLLDRPVREYADNLQEQIYVVWRKLGVKDVHEFDRAVQEKKVAFKDAEEVRDLLRRLRDAVQKNEISREAFFGPFVDAETRHLRKFFGQEIDVPPVPDSLTPELYEFLKKNRFELHYFPLIGMYEDSEYPGWKDPIRRVWRTGEKISFARANSEQRLVAGSQALAGEWVMVDARPVPDFTKPENHIEYDGDDVIGPLLEKFRRGLLMGVNPSYWPNARSRFGIRHSDLRDIFWEKLAEKLSLPGSARLRLPRAVEWNYIANAFHPEWFRKNTSEWILENWFAKPEDHKKYALRIGSDPKDSVIVTYNNAANSNVGFRPIITFY